MEYSTKESVEALSKIDPQFREFLEQNDLEDYMYDVVSAAATIVLPEDTTDPTAPEYVVDVPMRDGYKNQIRVHKPTTPQPNKKRALVVLIHAGGFMTGDNRQLSCLARVLSNLYNTVAVTTNHRLAPRYTYPRAAEDTWDTVKWLAANAASLGADLSVGFIVGGGDSGGNLAAVTTQKSIEEKLSPPITGVWMDVPLLLDESIVPEKYKDVFISREQNVDAPLLHKEVIDQIFDSYQPEYDEPEWSPINSKYGVKEWPTTFIQVAGWDPVRDDGLIFARILMENGVKTMLEVYPGVPHAHGLFPFLAATDRFNRDIVRCFGEMLNVPVTKESLDAGAKAMGEEFERSMGLRD